MSQAHIGRDASADRRPTDLIIRQQCYSSFHLLDTTIACHLGFVFLFEDVIVLIQYKERERGRERALTGVKALSHKPLLEAQDSSQKQLCSMIRTSELQLHSSVSDRKLCGTWKALDSHLHTCVQVVDVKKALLKDFGLEFIFRYFNSVVCLIIIISQRFYLETYQYGPENLTSKAGIIAQR